jgi:hypothetical protein
MGWDAYARVPKRGEKRKSVLAAFAEAANRVQHDVGTCDGLLGEGGLDISDCGAALEEATGYSVRVEDGWSAQFVRQVAVEACWDEVADDFQPWAVESARSFLSVCADSFIGIDFSW